MVQLIEISPKEYRLSGEVNYQCQEYKAVVVDGETYHKEVWHSAVLSYDEEFEKEDRRHKWIRIEIDEFDFLGLNFVVWDFRWRHKTGIEELRKTIYSENHYATVLGVLFDLGLIPALSYHTGRWLGHHDSLRYHLFELTQIQVPLCEYAGGNRCVCHISLIDFLNNKIPKRFWEYKYFYNQYIPELKHMKPGDTFTDEQKYTIAERLFSHQIQHFENEQQQRPIRPYLFADGEIGAKEDHG